MNDALDTREELINIPSGRSAIAYQPGRDSFRFGRSWARATQERGLDFTHGTHTRSVNRVLPANAKC
jgi:hypothetical protein